MEAGTPPAALVLRQAQDAVLMEGDAIPKRHEEHADPEGL
jgi:hypothetical protein